MSILQRSPMTIDGEALLKQELENLKKVQRPAVIADIAEARAHGDLSENAEYHAAREQQSFIEGRIREVESKLSQAVVIDVTSMTNDNKVIFGSTVTLENCTTAEITTYKIVGQDEADVKQGKLSVTSPIARALIGKMLDDEVVVKTPGGEVEYVITAVKYI